MPSIDAEIVRMLETIAMEQGFKDVEALLRDYIASYAEQHGPAKPPTPEELQNALREGYAGTAEARAEAWARDLLTR